MICLKCLEKDPRRRYAGAGPWPRTWTAGCAGEPIPARPVGPATRAAMWCRRHPLPAALTGLLVLAVIIGIAGVTWKWREAAAARDESEAINDFLVHKLLDQASPRFNPRGAGLTVGELLDRTSASLGGVFDGQARRGGIHPPDARLDLSGPRSLREGRAPLPGGHRARFPRPRRGRSPDPPRRESPGRDARRGRTVRGGRAALESSSRPSAPGCSGQMDRTSLEAEYQLGMVSVHLQKLDDAERILRHCVEGQRKVPGPRRRADPPVHQPARAGAPGPGQAGRGLFSRR